MASQESLRKSRVPMYILASLLTSLGGFLNGFDTGSIGSLTSMPQFQSSIEHLSHSQLGFTVSLIMLAGAVPSAFAGTLADRLGRLRVVFIGAIVFVIGATIEAAARNLITFNIGRTLAGLGEGVYLSSVSVLVLVFRFFQLVCILLIITTDISAKSRRLHSAAAWLASHNSKPRSESAWGTSPATPACMSLHRWHGGHHSSFKLSLAWS